MRSILFIILYLIAFEISAQPEKLRKTHFNLENTLAIDGYDPVAYFNKSKALEGKKEFALTYLGIPYYFSSSENRDLFNSNPGKYEPQYGGWCAFAMGNSGEKVEVNPETFKVLNGKLYLFYNKFFNNTLNSWNKNEGGLTMQADEHWSNIVRTKR